MLKKIVLILEKATSTFSPLFSKIRHKRQASFSLHSLMFFLGLLSFLASLGVFSFFLKNLHEIDNLWNEMLELKDKSERVAAEKNERDFYLKKYGAFEPYYLSKQLGALSFLKTEKEYLSEVLNIPAYVGSQEIKKKLKEISDNHNRISLQEVDRKRKPPLEQVEWKWEFPVLVEEEDLENILTIVEGMQIGGHVPPEGRPQLFFKEFNLKRIRTDHFFERYEIDAKILQRTHIP